MPVLSGVCPQDLHAVFLQRHGEHSLCLLGEQFSLLCCLILLAGGEKGRRWGPLHGSLHFNRAVAHGLRWPQFASWMRAKG